jgi:predicted anti-sigma-YlaC factor YlaD
MSAHLTHEELTDNLLGVSSLTVNAHLLNCSTCANELEQMKGAIAGFRSAASAWSESALTAERPMPGARALPKRSSSAGWAAGWTLASAALILFAVSFAFYVRDNQAPKQASSVQVAPPVTTETAQSQIEKDNELLSQVNSELAEAVPAPMQPLRLLDATASSTSETK